MRALRGYLLLGALVFAIVIAATLPARILLPWLPTRLALQDVSGTLWDGAAAQLSLDGTALGQVQWQLSPLGLLRARLTGVMTITRPDGRLSGHLSLRRGGELEAQALSLDLPLNTLHPESTQATWQGRIHGDVAYARLEQGWPVALEGRFTIEHLQAPNAVDDLGRFVLTFDPRDSTPEALLGRLHDEGGPLIVTAQLRLEPARAYQLAGDVARARRTVRRTGTRPRVLRIARRQWSTPLGPQRNVLMTDNTTIVDVPERSRFEWVMGEHVAIVTYRRDGSVLWLNHAGVPPALGGRGLGRQLVDGVLQQIRDRGEQVVPVCSFIARHIERHPQYQDLVANR
jgi:predicted GNAT family acetyltransferase